MQTGLFEVVLGYQLGHFIFDYWQIALFFLLCLVDVWLIGWAHKRRSRNDAARPALRLDNVVVAFAIAVIVWLIGSPIGQSIFLVGAALALAFWYSKKQEHSQPFYLLATLLAVGALIGLGFLGLSLAFSIICALALALQRKPAA